MELRKSESGVSVHTFYYALRIEPERFLLLNPRADDPLIDCPTPVFFKPVLAGKNIAWKLGKLQAQSAASGPVKVTITAAPDTDALGELTITVLCYERHCEFTARCRANRQLVLAQWDLFAAGAKLTAYWAHHFRNRHGHNLPYETYNLVRGSAELQPPRAYPPEMPKEMVKQWTEDAEFSTFSFDWQFAPHPSFILFQKDETMLCLGAKDLPQAFGLETIIGRNTIKKLCLDYGGAHGFPVAAGQELPASAMYLWLDHHADIWGSVDHYVDLLIEDGKVPRRSLRNAPSWWLKPVYCTWHDQGYLAQHTYSHLHKTDGWTGGKKGEVGKKTLKKTKAGGRYNALTPDMISRVLHTIKKEKLPFGSIILDASWFVCQGQWEADPARFPEMRREVERIHAAGLKAILWLSPMMFDPASAAARHREWLLNGGEILAKYPYPQLDFSHPQAQEQYVRPTMKYLLSDAPGCLNADGVKIDYLAGKVFPEYRVHDLAWRGEERFVRNTMKLYYDEMKRYKPDACLIGISLHPYFIDCQDLIRTYDVTGSQCQHEERAKMIAHFCPGNFISFDFVEERRNWEKYFSMAEAYNGLVEHSHILGIEGKPLTKTDYEFLRSRLNRWR